MLTISFVKRTSRLSPNLGFGGENQRSSPKKWAIIDRAIIEWKLEEISRAVVSFWHLEQSCYHWYMWLKMNPGEINSRTASFVEFHAKFHKFRSCSRSWEEQAQCSLSTGRTRRKWQKTCLLLMWDQWDALSALSSPESKVKVKDSHKWISKHDSAGVSQIDLWPRHWTILCISSLPRWCTWKPIRWSLALSSVMTPFLLWLTGSFESVESVSDMQRSIRRRESNFQLLNEHWCAGFVLP